VKKTSQRKDEDGTDQEPDKKTRKWIRAKRRRGKWPVAVMNVGSIPEAWRRGMIKGWAPGGLEPEKGAGGSGGGGANRAKGGKGRRARKKTVPHRASFVYITRHSGIVSPRLRKEDLI